MNFALVGIRRWSTMSNGARIRDSFVNEDGSLIDAFRNLPSSRTTTTEGARLDLQLEDGGAGAANGSSKSTGRSKAKIGVDSGERRMSFGKMVLRRFSFVERFGLRPTALDEMTVVFSSERVMLTIFIG